MCSAHFLESDFQLHTKTKTLKPDAVPTVFPNYPKHKQTPSTSRRAAPLKRPIPSSNPASKEPGGKLRKKEVICSINQDHHYAKKSIEHELKKQTERNEILSGKVTNARKEIKVLKTKVKRKSKKIQDIFSELEKKNMIDSERLELLMSNLSQDSKLLFDNELQQTNASVSGRRYSDNIKSFAVTLHFYSPQAYEYLRKHLTLPDVSTIRRWSSSIGCEPGFLEDALDHLKSRMSENRMMRDICIIFDSMAIKKELVFDSKTGKYSGCVDFGTSSDSSDHLATEALVVMAVGLRTHWKQPIAYFLVDKICSNVQSQIVHEAVIQLTERGFIVHAAVCDGNFANQKTAVNLGCVLEPDRVLTEFKHPSGTGESIFFLFDVCHLLKNVRNCFGQYGVLSDGDGQQISWEFVKALHEEQQKDNLFLGNKLASKHIDFVKNKMSVKLAAETLSRSVADAIEYLREEKDVPRFRGSEATCKFIRTFDKLFDICNSSSPIGKYSKSPISLSNLKEKLEDLDNIKIYIRGLTDSTGTPLTTGRRKTAFIGFVVTITSLQKLAQRLLHQNDPFKYVLSYKLSQDHLECLFSRIRRRGGWNNNPTSLQFKWALRACMLKNGIRPSKHANCIEIEEPEMSIIDDNRERIFPVSQELKQFLKLVKEPSHFHDDVLFYIAGFICHKLMLQLKCFICLNAIGKRVSSSPDIKSNPTAALTLNKDRGGLMYSNEIFRIVREADCVLRQILLTNHLTSLSSKVIISVQIAVNAKLRDTIFKDLADHIQDTYNPLADDHGTQIIKLVCRIFTNLVFRRNAKVINERFVGKCKAPMRQKYSKMILFLHQ